MKYSLQESIQPVSDYCKECMRRNSALPTGIAEESRSPSTSTSTLNSYQNGRICSLNATTLEDLLKNSAIGVEICQYHATHNKLNDSHRDILTSIIVDNFSDNNIGMQMTDIVSSTNAIQALFSSETTVRLIFYIFFFHVLFIFLIFFY